MIADQGALPQEQIEALKPGDKVGFKAHNSVGVSGVKKLTDTQIVLDNDYRFNKRGMLRGNGNFGDRLLTVEYAMARVEELRSKRILRETREQIIELVRDADLETLGQIRALFPV